MFEQHKWCNKCGKYEPLCKQYGCKDTHTCERCGEEWKDSHTCKGYKPGEERQYLELLKHQRDALDRQIRAISNDIDGSKEDQVKVSDAYATSS